MSDDTQRSSLPLPGLRLTLLWLTGLDLRVTLLAVPPLLPLIRSELNLDEKGVAVLSSLPVLLFGLAAVPGSLLVARAGPIRVLLVGLSMIALASVLRGVGSSAVMLYGMTFLLGLGISISQPAMPLLVRQWFPTAVARTTALWSNGLLVGELVGAALPLAVLLPLLGGRWELALGVVALPAFCTVVLLATVARRIALPTAFTGGSGWPNWRQARTWQLGLLQSSAALIYFGSNTFLPDYLHTYGHADLIGPALTVLNFSQVPASVVFGLLPRRYITHPGVVTTVGVLVLAGLPPLLAEQPLVVLASVALLGFASAYILVVVFALPALLAPEREVARMAASSATIGYCMAFASNLAAGAIWDATHFPVLGFLPVLAGAAIVLLLGPRLVAAAARVEAPARS